MLLSVYAEVGDGDGDVGIISKVQQVGTALLAIALAVTHVAAVNEF